MDTNGNGKRDAYVEPDQPVDPTKDKRFGGGVLRGRRRRPTARSGASVLGYPGRGRAAGRRARIRRRPRSPRCTSRRSTIRSAVPGFSPRGMDIDRNGVVWAALASGHMASFDRRKCKGPLNGPNATGQHCPEGWTLYAEPLPQLKGVTGLRQRRGELLHVGRSVRHARPRQRTCRSTPATSPKGCSC